MQAIMQVPGFAEMPVCHLPEGCFSFCFTGPAPSIYNFVPGDLLIIDSEHTDSGLVAVKFPGNDLVELRELVSYNEQERLFVPIMNGVPKIYENAETPKAERGQVLGRVCWLFRSMQPTYTENKEESNHEEV